MWNNPVLRKEYRLRMRSTRAPWIISVYLLIMGGIALSFIYLVTSGDGFFDPGMSRTLFIMLSTLQLALIGFVAPGLTAGLISGERERQTLAILLTTDLSPLSIIVSKLTASLSFMTLLVFASLPLYSIVFLFGGVSPVQLLQVLAFYLVAMLFVGSMGIFYSTLFKRTGVATVLAYCSVAVIVLGTLIIGMFASQFYALSQAGGAAMPQSPPFWITMWFLLNPAFDFFALFGLGDLPFVGQTGVDPYLFYLIVYGSLSILFIGLATYVLTPVHKKRHKQKKTATEGE